MSDLRQIHPGDNIAVATHALEPGSCGGLAIVAAIPAGHKVAVVPIAAGTEVIKYGYPIGRASRDIRPGEHVHTHNVVTALGEDTVLCWQGGAVSATVEMPGERTVMAYRREDGRIAIRNEIWIINTVACVNTASQRIAQLAAAELVHPDSGIDGVHAFPHPYGCSQLGDDLGHTRDLLAALARHPHAAGVLVLGLGCENNHLRGFLESLGECDPRRIRFFNAQDVGDEIARGVEEVRALAGYARQFRREPVDAGELVLAMKCGGSDGFSGITANPLVGRVGDMLAALGGTVLLSEVPEMFGAEEALFSRCDRREVFEAAVGMVNDFKEYYRRHGEPIHENPSPGNKDGGITTLEEKSLGCVQKAGHAPVRAVVRYARAALPGLGGVCLVEAPGNDGVSCTAMAAAGANLILFTTGRGTPLGVPVPTMKIASNSGLAQRKPSWIDFNAGALVDGTGAPLEDLAARLWRQVLDVAGGSTTCNERNGFREITLWKQGVTL